MTALRTLVAGIFLVFSGIIASADTATFPQVTIKDLNGRQLSFPKRLPAERTMVLIAFKREQQSDLDTWINALGLKSPGAPAWIEMPVIANYGSIFRSFVDNGMRSGIVSKSDRARVFTLYADPSKFRSRLNLPTDRQVYVLVVNRTGAVLGQAAGTYSKKRAAVIFRAMGLSPS